MSPGGYGPPGGGYGPPGGGYGPPGGGYGPPGGGYGPPGGHFGGPPGYGHPPHGYSPGVEFGPAENAVIDGTATWARILGIVGFVQAGYQFLSLNPVGAVVSFVVALAFFKGGTSLRVVTQSQGQDVHHLVSALGQFGGAFMMRIVLTALALGIVVLVGGGFLIMAIAIAAG